MNSHLLTWWKLRWVSVFEILLVGFVALILQLEIRLFFPVGPKSTPEYLPEIKSVGSVPLMLENGTLFNNPAGFAGSNHDYLYFAWWDYPLLTMVPVEDPLSNSNWDSDNIGQHPFVNPAFVLMDQDDFGEIVWLLDAGNGWIYKIDAERNIEAKINSAVWGVYNPQGLALDGEGNFYIADTGSSRILKSDVSGNLMTEWGSLGKRKNQLNDPKGMVISGESLFVVDSNNNRVVHFDLNGKWINSWSIDEGSYDIAVDNNDLLYVVSRENNLIQVFSMDGNAISAISPEMLNLPNQNITGISISTNGNIYIMEEDEVAIFHFDWN